jgi:hypothetical protein
MGSGLLEAANGQLRLLQGVAGLQVHGGFLMDALCTCGQARDSKDQGPGSRGYLLPRRAGWMQDSLTYVTGARKQAALARTSHVGRDLVLDTRCVQDAHTDSAIGL